MAPGHGEADEAQRRAALELLERAYLMLRMGIMQTRFGADKPASETLSEALRMAADAWTALGFAEL